MTWSGSSRSSSRASSKWSITPGQKQKVRERDQGCVVTGKKTGVSVSHVVECKWGELGDRHVMKTAANAFLLSKTLEIAYDDYMWSFDVTGKLIVHFEGYEEAAMLKKKGSVGSVTVSGLDRGHIQARLDHAQQQAAQRCPCCWRLVGKVNIYHHRRNSCPSAGVADAVPSSVAMGELSGARSDEAGNGAGARGRRQHQGGERARNAPRGGRHGQITQGREKRGRRRGKNSPNSPAAQKSPAAKTALIHTPEA